MEKINIVCPRLFPDNAWSESEALGSMVWLWHFDKDRSDATLTEIMGFLMPPIKSKQFVTFYETGKPIGYITWANFSSPVESLYVQSHFNILENTKYWNCGDRTWIIDYFAPFGHHKKIFNLTRNLFPHAVMRTLSHFGTEGKNKVMLYRGVSVSYSEMRHWDKTHPLNF